MEKPLERLIFASRWLQAPLYLGLIIAQGIYVYQFFIELWHLVGVAMHGVADPTKGPDTSTTIMLGVLGLIDVVMIANLLLMVIIGGYETFVSRLNLDTHPDQPEWLSHVNAGALKVKLATALISISSIHLLKTFIEVRLPTHGLQERRCDVAGDHSRALRALGDRAGVGGQIDDGERQDAARVQALSAIRSDAEPVCVRAQV